MGAYSHSIVGVLVLCLLSIVLAVYSGSSKGRAGALSGPVLPLDDDNLLYRIDRVHLNTVATDVRWRRGEHAPRAYARA